MWPDPAQARDTPNPPARPGLGKKDRAIWDWLIDHQQVPGVRWWWNQVVGQEPPWLKDVDNPNLERWARATYLKRPDVIYEAHGSLWAAEIKPYASYVALGQAILYARLAEHLTDPPRRVLPVLITDAPDPDLLSVLELGDPALIQIGHLLEERPAFPT